MAVNSILTITALCALFLYVGKKLLSTRDLLLVAGAAGTVGFLLAGAFHRWALQAGLLFLVLESFYLGVLYRDRTPGLVPQIFAVCQRIQAQTAFVMGVGLIIFLTYAIEQGEKNVASLAQHIEIYEPNSSVEWVPRVGNDVIGRWILTTDDSAQSVTDFYRRLAERDGWIVHSASPPSFLSMQKDNLKVTFMSQESGRAAETVTIITLDNITR